MGNLQKSDTFENGLVENELSMETPEKAIFTSVNDDTVVLIDPEYATATATATAAATATASSSEPERNVPVWYRWFIVFICAPIMLFSGTLYAFPSYSLRLAKVLHINHVERLGAAGDLGFHTSILVGIFHDRYGQRLTTALSALLVGVAYFCIIRVKLSVPMLWFLYFIVGSANYGLSVSAQSSCASQFSSEYRSRTLGYCLSLYAMGAMMFSLIFQDFLHSNVHSLFILFCICGVAITVLCAPFLVQYKLTPTIQNESESETESSKPSKLAVLGYLDFWLLFICFGAVTGSSLLYKNVLGGLAEAYGMATSTSAFVLIWSSGNAISRIVSGAVVDATSKFLSKPSWLLICCSSLLFIHIGLATCFISLWIAAVVIAAAYGFSMTTSLSCLSLYFGVSRYGSNYALLSLAPAITDTSLTWLAGVMLSKNCSHPECYKAIFSISTALIFSGILSGIVLRRRRLQKELSSTNRIRTSYLPLDART